jgi:hypothetical protein
MQHGGRERASTVVVALAVAACGGGGGDDEVGADAVPAIVVVDEGFDTFPNPSWTAIADTPLDGTRGQPAPALGLGTIDPTGTSGGRIELVTPFSTFTPIEISLDIARADVAGGGEIVVRVVAGTNEVGGDHAILVVRDGEVGYYFGAAETLEPLPNDTAFHTYRFAQAASGIVTWSRDGVQTATTGRGGFVDHVLRIEAHGTADFAVDNVRVVQH